MKRILTYTTFCLLLVFASCSEEQLDVYNGDNYVYFTYMSDKSPQKIYPTHQLPKFNVKL